jgi:hypothetical protein
VNKDYLSDSAVSVNRIRIGPKLLTPAEPMICTVTIENSTGVIATQNVAEGDLINLEGLTLSPATGGDTKGAIGTTTDGDLFYPWTSITGDCTVTLY